MARSSCTNHWLAAVFGASLVTLACGGGGGTSPTSPNGGTTPPGTGGPPPASTSVRWEYNGTAWAATGTAPACPSPLTFTTPVDLSRVTSILYPGQSRPDYKPHGGFRFDNPGQSNDLTFVAPMAGYVYRGARFLTGGEIQYTFDIVNTCGVMYRVGHLRELPARFQAFANAFPAATEGDSRTTLVPEGQTVAAGEVIGTAVGLRGTSNVFADWGVFDLRQKNAASADPSWLAAHPGELAPYGICWLANLSAADSALVQSLPPGDPGAGRTSDFCR